MKKTLWLLLAIFALCAPAFAGIEEALESCRSADGLLPDTPGGTYSSRVLVQEMHLRLLRDDRESFSTLYGLMRKYFQSPLMLLYRQLDADLKPVAYENSMAADLQVCRLLLEAAARWDVPDYKVHALKMARRILRFNVYRDVLVNSASWKERRSGINSIYEPSHILDLSGVDIQALHLLQSEMPEWEPVAQRCLGILLAGSGENTLRLRYNVERKTYLGFDSDSDDALRIIVNLLDGGLVPLRPMERLILKLRLEPRCFARGDLASLSASTLCGYVMARTGHFFQSQQVFKFLEESFASDGLYAEPGKEPSVSDNLLYLTIRHILEPRKNR